MSQAWCDLLFAHWPVPADSLRPHIPPGLRIDTFGGSAWIGIVPFFMRQTRPFRLPLPFGLGDLPELNVRTYVVAEDKPGVWFFSLDAASRPAVRAARFWYHLPYFDARMSVSPKDDAILYQSQRTHRDAPTAEFSARYRPTGDVYHSRTGSLDQWLTERYCLYAADRHGWLYRGENDHVQWPLQPAEAEIERNTMTRPIGLTLPQMPPILHFARRIEAIFWPLQRLG